MYVKFYPYPFNRKKRDEFIYVWDRKIERRVSSPKDHSHIQVKETVSIGAIISTSKNLFLQEKGQLNGYIKEARHTMLENFRQFYRESPLPLLLAIATLLR